jgi:hypothetical protein
VTLFGCFGVTLSGEIRGSVLSHFEVTLRGDSVQVLSHFDVSLSGEIQCLVLSHFDVSLSGEFSCKSLVRFLYCVVELQATRRVTLHIELPAGSRCTQDYHEVD